MKLASEFLKYSVLLLLIISSLITNAQVGPPPAAMPSDENTRWIDSIIKVTHHEDYFKNYCTEKVKNYAIAKKWPASKANSVLQSIQFKNYSSTIYNSYANYPVADLKKLLVALKQINKKCNDWSCMILTNSMMQNNLDVFVEALIEGKYVTN